jgi:hypothetical protein
MDAGNQMSAQVKVHPRAALASLNRLIASRYLAPKALER